MGPNTGPNFLCLVSGKESVRKHHAELPIKSKSYYTLTLSKLNLTFSAGNFMKFKTQQMSVFSLTDGVLTVTATLESSSFI